MAAKVVLKKIKHIMTIGTEKYSFQAPDIYGDFGAQLGVTKAPNPDTTNYKGKLHSEDYSNGKVIHIKARGSVTDSAGAVTEARDFTYTVAFDKARTALANLDSKKVTVNSKTYDLGSARIPQRRRFS
jgi:hypothetical protein